LQSFAKALISFFASDFSLPMFRLVRLMLEIFVRVFRKAQISSKVQHSVKRLGAQIKQKSEMRFEWRYTMDSPIRRVVTGKDRIGKAIVLSDGAASHVHVRKELGVTNTVLWVADPTPAKLSEPGDAANREVAVVPPQGGTIFRIVEFGPVKDVQVDYQTQRQIFERMGLAPE
jgi:hypothetical protein